MTATISEEGALLAYGSLSLLGASAHGSAAIEQFGFPRRDFDPEFADLVRTLEASGEDDSAAGLEISRRIVALAKQAFGWLSITGDEPTLIFFCGRQVLVARIHGPLVEWIAGDASLASRTVRLVASGSTGAPTMVTAHSQTDAVCGLLIQDGTVDVAARDEAVLRSLTTAAHEGLEELLEFVSKLLRALNHKLA